MKSLTLYLSLFILLLITAGAQCRKEQIVCTGNCASIHVTGQTINQLNGMPAGGVPFKVTWAVPRITIGPETYIYEGVSDKNGKFDFVTAIDTTKFSKEDLILQVKKNDTWMAHHSDPDSLVFYNYNPSALQNINVGVYPEVQLTLALQHTQTDSWNSLLIEYGYENGNTYSAFQTNFPQQFTSQEVVVPTAAGVPTIITIIKGRNGGSFDQSIDTIVCHQGVANRLALQL